jgi:hypothetical protein
MRSLTLLLFLFILLLLMTRTSYCTSRVFSCELLRTFPKVCAIIVTKNKENFYPLSKFDYLILTYYVWIVAHLSKRPEGAYYRGKRDLLQRQKRLLTCPKGLRGRCCGTEHTPVYSYSPPPAPAARTPPSPPPPPSPPSPESLTLTSERTLGCG